MLSGQNGILNRAQEAKEKTSEAYKDENGKLQGYEDAINSYGVNLPKEEGTIPYIPNSTFSYKEGDLNTGLVIEDADNNEYVWVEVPTTIYENTDYNSNGTKKPANAEDYVNIESCLKAYTSEYSDTSYSDTNSNFTTQYQAMLKSVYTNGGFWIGRYEAGIDGETPRISHTDLVDKVTIKQNKFPYNVVTRNEAQTLAEEMNYNGCTSSLLFGIQWDLVLKYIETKNATTKENLLSDSTKIGNYYNSELTLNRGKFTQFGVLSKWYDYNGDDKTSLVEDGKKKSQSSHDNAIILTTGSTDDTKLQNIYDIAGNVWEWTLELGNNYSYVYRGGSYFNEGVEDTAKKHSGNNDNSTSYSDIGFRIGLWK